MYHISGHTHEEMEGSFPARVTAVFPHLFA